MSFNFAVRIHNIRAKIDDKQSSLRINFANFKTFETKQPIAIIQGDAVPSPADVEWVFDKSFHYETRNVDALSLRKLSIDVIGENTETIGTLSVDLYTIACGPTEQEMDLIKNGQVVATFFFTVEMSQINDVELCIRSINVTPVAPLDRCFIQYSNTLRTHGKPHRSTISDNPYTPFWQNLEKMWVSSCSLQDLCNGFLVIQLYRKVHQQQVFIGEGKIRLETCIRPTSVTSSVPFSAVIYQNPHSTVPIGPITISGILESTNVPKFIQMHDAKTINGAAWIGRQSHPVFPPSAPQVLQVSIPRFYQINEARDFVLSQVMKEKKAIRETITGDVFFLEHYIPDVVTVAGSNVEYVLEVDGLLSCVQANVPIIALPQKYFEVRLEKATPESEITIGLTPPQYPLNVQPGHAPHSYGYRSDTGNKYITPSRPGSPFVAMYSPGHLFAPPFGLNDTVGCGVVEIEDGLLIYFTRNGIFIDYVEITKEEFLIPTVSMTSKGSAVRVNLNQENEAFLFSPTDARPVDSTRITLDRFGKLVYIYQNVPSFVDPRRLGDEEALNYKKFESHQNWLISNLKNVQNIRYSDGGNNRANKSTKWHGLDSERLIHALTNVPRSAFVPRQLQSIANFGQHLKYEVEGTKIDMTSTTIIARALDALELVPGHSFLDIGCGTGYISAVAASIIGGNKEVLEDTLDSTSEEFKSSRGSVVGVDIEDSWIEYSRDHVLEFSRTCERRFDLDVIDFQKRNVFQRITEENEPDDQNDPDRFIFEHVQLNEDDYDRIFCGVSVTRQHYADLYSLVNKLNGRVVVHLQETDQLVLLKISQDGEHLFDEFPLMKIPKGTFTPAVLPSRRDRYWERKKQLISNLENGFGFLKDEIELALRAIATKPQRQDQGIWFIYEGPQVDESFLADYYSEISRVAYEILTLYNNPSFKHSLSIDGNQNAEEILLEILEAQEVFHGDMNKSLIYLTNVYHMSRVFNCPHELIREAFTYFNFDPSFVSVFLRDVNLARHQIERQKTLAEDLASGSGAINSIMTSDGDDMIREICQALVLHKNLHTALFFLLGKPYEDIH